MIAAGGVHVISLPGRQARLDRLTARWPLPHVALNVHEAIADPDPVRGCLRSHLAVLAAAAGPALILEDDAVFADGFTLELRPPADWQVLWLGRQCLAPQRPVDAVWSRPWRIARTHAYVARDPQDLFGRLVRCEARSIDPTLSELAVPQYMLRIATVGQAAGRSDITGRLRLADEFWND